MIKYYTNRELSEVLGFKLAKWKRWSREFLPPDPLGGMQSGYARQYTPDEAFTVYLGGHLVADLNFTIPGARQILQDLLPWRSESGFDFSAAITLEKTGREAAGPARHYLIYIMPTGPAHAAEPSLWGEVKSSAGFRYLVRGILSTTPSHGSADGAMTEHFVEASLQDVSSPPPTLTDMSPVKLLNATILLKRFVERLGIDPAGYAALR